MGLENTGLPLKTLIHSRESLDETSETVEIFCDAKTYGPIFMPFQGMHEQAKKIIELGLLFGNRRGRHLLRMVDLTEVLPEMPPADRMYWNRCSLPRTVPPIEESEMSGRIFS